MLTGLSLWLSGRAVGQYKPVNIILDRRYDKYKKRSKLMLLIN